MGVVTDIQPLLDASRQRAELAAKPVRKIAETPAEYGKISVLTDARAIAVYAQLKTTGLDTSTCLRATALAAQIKVLKHSELETRSIYYSSIWQTLPSSAIARLQKLSAADYTPPQQYIDNQESLLLNWQAGAMSVLFFDANGLVIQRLEMAETRCRLIKIPANVYYTLLTADHCLYLTMMPQNTLPQLANWAPAKDHAQQPDYQKQLVNAKIGDRITLSTL